MARVWIGTSGWVYKDWFDVLYPSKTPPGRFLPIYAARFPAVEINRSYYRLPDRNVFEGWRAQSPPGFLFAVKASRFLTHMKKLKDPEQPLERLMTAATGLGEKLGPVLFQFPRQWRLNRERLEYFLGALRPCAPTRFAFEFRHESWLTPGVYRLLGEAGCALCLAGRLGHPARRPGHRALDLHPDARRRAQHRLFRRGACNLGRAHRRVPRPGPRRLCVLQQRPERRRRPQRRVPHPDARGPGSDAPDPP